VGHIWAVFQGVGHIWAVFQGLFLWVPTQGRRLPW